MFVFLSKTLQEWSKYYLIHSIEASSTSEYDMLCFYISYSYFLLGHILFMPEWLQLYVLFPNLNNFLFVFMLEKIRANVNFHWCVATSEWLRWIILVVVDY